MPSRTAEHPLVDHQKSPVTQLLMDWSNGDASALDALMPLVYNELRRLARDRLHRERPGHTLQGTGLVHEAYLRLVDQKTRWQSRAHFFGIAAQLMRRIILDHARANQTAKRGAGAVAVQLDEAIHSVASPDRTLLLLDHALNQFEKIDPKAAKIVELKFFGGLSAGEISEVEGISTATVQRKWKSARVWLHHAVDQNSTQQDLHLEGR